MALTGFPSLEADLVRTVQEAALDYESFQTPLRTCQLVRCKGMCCHDGVFVGKEEQRVIASKLEGDFFEASKGRTKTRTISASEEMLGEGYPAHFPKTRCVFLDEQHHCRLQSLAMAEGKHPWFWKPFPCWLHPLGFQRNGSSGRPILSLPIEERDPACAKAYPGFASYTTCGRRDESGPPAWQTLQAELGFLSEISGRDLIAELAPTRDSLS